MNPITLTIKGLNSFAEEQTIDFQRLTRHGIFGIFGPTGSGKTTIIDAITIALYDKTPRMEKERSIKLAFNVNSEEIYISFTFSIYREHGSAETVYTVVRAYKKTPTAYKIVTARLYTNGEQTDVLADKPDETTKKINELIGLTYDDFVRSVVLPQGKFSEFLFLANKERRAMLERIFRLEKYGERLNQRTRQRYNDCKNEIALTDSQLEIIGDISAETVKKETSVHKELTEALFKDKETLTGKQAEYEVIKKLYEAEKEHEQYLRENEKLLARREQMSAAEERLRRGERAEKILPLITQQSELKQKLAKICGAKTKLQEEYSVYQKNYTLSQSEYELALREKDEKYPEILQRQAKLSEAVKFAESKKELEEQREKLLKEYTELKKSCDSLQKQESVLEAEISGHDLELVKVDESKSKIYVEPQIRQKIEDCCESERKEKELKDEIALLNAKVVKYRDAYNKSAKEAALLGEKISAAEKDLAAAKKHEENTLAYKLAETLAEGQPCPVCGSTSHPAAARLDLSGVSAGYSDLEKELNKLAVKRAALLGALQSDKKTIDENEEILREKQTAYKSASAVLEGLRTEMGIVSFNGALLKIKENEKEADKLSKIEKKLRTEKEQKQKLLAEAKNRLSEINTQIAAVVTSGNEKKEAISRQQEQILRLTQGRELNEEITLLHAVAEKITTAEKKAKEVLAKIEAKKQKTYESLLESIKQEEANRGVAEELAEKLSASLIELGFASVEEAAGCVVAGKDSIKTEIEAYKDRLKLIAGNIERLSGILKGHDNISQKAETLKNEIRVLEDVITQKTEQAAVIGERIRKMNENLEKSEALSAKKKSLTRALDILEDLTKLFAGNQFVEFIAKRQLKYIASETSRRLSRMTSGRYALELDETDFVIQDNFNGGIRRSPKTLSGGETFIVSLCLALALSTKVQLTQNAPLQLFFLDEGFGTLDAALLDTVMDTLEKLRLEKLTVGVITHVEELKDRIPLKLIVEPAVQGMRGTRVRIEE